MNKHTDKHLEELSHWIHYDVIEKLNEFDIPEGEIPAIGHLYNTLVHFMLYFGFDKEALKGIVDFEYDRMDDMLEKSEFIK